MFHTGDRPGQPSYSVLGNHTPSKAPKLVLSLLPRRITISRLTLSPLTLSASDSKSLNRPSMSSFPDSRPFQLSSFNDNFCTIKDTSDDEYVAGLTVATLRLGRDFRLEGFDGPEGVAIVLFRGREPGDRGELSKLSKSPSDKPNGMEGGAMRWRFGVDGPLHNASLTESRLSSSLTDRRRFLAPRAGVCGRI